jgi:hypothetical protein
MSATSDTEKDRLEGLRIKAMKRFFRFMGISGWVLLPVLGLENRIALPIGGVNIPLDICQLLTIIVWAIARFVGK